MNNLGCFNVSSANPNMNPNISQGMMLPQTPGRPTPSVVDNMFQLDNNNGRTNNNMRPSGAQGVQQMQVPTYPQIPPPPPQIDFRKYGDSQNGIPISEIKKPNNSQQTKKVIKEFDSDNDNELENDTIPNESDKRQTKIKHLVKDINKSLDKFAPSYSKDSDTELSDHTNYELEDKSEKINNNDGILLSYSNIREFLVLLVLYTIISQPFVKRCVESALPQISVTDEGTPFMNYIVYGTLLAVLFMFTKLI